MVSKMLLQCIEIYLPELLSNFEPTKCYLNCHMYLPNGIFFFPPMQSPRRGQSASFDPSDSHEFLCPRMANQSQCQIAENSDG